MSDNNNKNNCSLLSCIFNSEFAKALYIQFLKRKLHIQKYKISKIENYSQRCLHTHTYTYRLYGLNG